jgi:DDE family transposase
LLRILGGEMHQAKMQFDATKEASRVFKDFTYQTKKTWSRERRVVGKAEHLAKGENPRFVVTSLSPDAFDAQTLYEQEYCARGNMENRIKEKKLFLFADRVSCQTMRANQVRLCLSTVAYLVMRALRDFGLRDTELSHAQCDTIRVKLLKIGATIRVSVRRVVLALSEAFPFQAIFQRAWQNLRNLRSWFTPFTQAPEHPPPDPAPCPN